MIKIIVGIAILFLMFFFGIQTVRSLSNKEKLKLTSLIKYTILCVSLSIISVATIVFLF